MRIVLLSSSASHRAGGVFTVLNGLATTLAERGRARVRVIALRDARTDSDAPCWRGVPVSALPVLGPAGFGYAPALSRELRDSGADLVHQHGLWMYPSRAAETWQRHSRRPRIISPHGMLNPAALALSRHKKRIAAWAYERRSLRRAGCLHALSEFEAAALRRAGLTQPVAVIPSGVSLPDVRVLTAGRPTGSRRRILYLGRICTNKGVAELVAAWGRLRRHPDPLVREWGLDIAGWGAAADVAALHAQVRDLGDEAGIRLLGPCYGEAKQAALLGAAALALPSAFEALPMTVLEAWAHGLAVLMTEGCQLPEGVRSGAALRIDAEPRVMAGQLHAFMSRSDAERTRMGSIGRRLVQARYAWPEIAGRFEALYCWLLGGGPAPDSLWPG
jgi:poly(glycerol-phosphate) alpha-glucosyltransferase